MLEAKVSYMLFIFLNIESNYNIRFKKKLFGDSSNKELTKINTKQLKEVFHKELFDLNLNFPQ